MHILDITLHHILLACFMYYLGNAVVAVKGSVRKLMVAWPL